MGKQENEMVRKWLERYEGLKQFKKEKLYCIVGPFAIGLELKKLPRVERYRPHFVVYSLFGLPSGTSLKDCFSYPVIMFELFNKKGLQFSLGYEEEITEVSQALDNFLSFGLGENISVVNLLSWLSEICENPNLKARIKLPEIWEVCYYLSMYYSSDKAITTLAEIKSNADRINKTNVFHNYGGYSEWLNDMTSLDRAKMMKILDKNKSNLDIKSLNKFEIID